MEEKIDKLPGDYLNEANLKHPTNDTSLWHYTTFDSFQNILKSKSFRSSHILNMNDSDEFKRGARFFIDEIHNHNIYESYENFFDDFINFINCELSEFSIVPYVMSFTLSKDDVGQWERYSSQYSGVSISCKSSLIGKVGKESNKLSWISKVSYSIEEQRKIVKEVVNGFLYFYSKNEEEISQSIRNVKNYNRAFWQVIAVLSCTWKSKQWECEKEVRLITLVDDLSENIKIEFNGNISKNFVEINFNNSCNVIFDEVMVGSLNKNFDVCKKLEIYQNNFDYFKDYNFKISKSNARPFVK